mgnify:CR=1 FL=1|tara:strand:- start:79 stop:777 length:699 start_codon:yes stop_codon:yes gene_type:complete
MRLKVDSDNGVWAKTDETSDNFEELDSYYQEHVMKEVLSRCKEDPSGCLPLLRRLLPVHRADVVRAFAEAEDLADTADTATIQVTIERWDLVNATCFEMENEHHVPAVQHDDLVATVRNKLRSVVCSTAVRLIAAASLVEIADEVMSACRDKLEDLRSQEQTPCVVERVERLQRATRLLNSQQFIWDVDEVVNAAAGALWYLMADFDVHALRDELQSYSDSLGRLLLLLHGD